MLYATISRLGAGAPQTLVASASPEMVREIIKVMVTRLEDENTRDRLLSELDPVEGDEQ